MKNKKTDIIIASYRENLNWINLVDSVLSNQNFLPNVSYKIYRTGDYWENATQLENRGREAGQWLAHIVNNYDNLADINFFVQADLAASFGHDGTEWPRDLNVIKQFRLPAHNHHELGPIDDYSFYTWPRLDRVRCTITEKGMIEDHVKGIPPCLEKTPTDPIIKSLWLENTPDFIKWPNGGDYLSAQHVVTKKFIQRLPVEYYSHLLYVVRSRELAHWLEHGKWPTIVYDIYRQGPLRENVVAKAKEKSEIIK